MQAKKLTLDTEKKSVLIAALSEAASTMSTDMRKIYDNTTAQVKHATDRILLTKAQVEIVKFALQHHRAKHGDNLNVRTMLDQLVLTRTEFTAKYANVA